ncbi:MAG: leucine-rich repeat domain-containing protein [Clostridia bacterium]|nr:leucine-rich repeat domain-containing protein [Clostridia bacterium]
MRKQHLCIAIFALLVFTLCLFVACEKEGVSCDHSFEYIQGKEPTCEEIGWKDYKRCNSCGYTDYVEIAPLGHAEEWHEFKSATCEEDGWFEYVSCSRCDYSTYVQIDAYGHDEVINSAKAPTCTEAGHDEYVSCSRCNYTTYVEKPALGHDIVSHEACAPTCENYGWNAYESCSRCDYTTYSEIWSTGHTPGAEATCTEDQICTTCNKVLVHANGHYYYGEATCTDDVKCQTCGEVITAALGHRIVKQQKLDPTCTQPGHTAYDYCIICGYSTKERIDPLGHTPGDEPTCEDPQICTVCEEILASAKGHTYGSSATCENDQLCTVCGEVLNKAYGHIETIHEGQAATCTEIGWEEYVTCSRWGCGYSTYVEIPALGHDYVNVGDTCSACSEIKASEGLEFRSNYNGTCRVYNIGECTDNYIVIPLVSPSGDKVVAIADNAFENCASVTAILIQDNVKTIGADAFSGCTALVSITVTEGNTSYSSIEGNLYNKDANTLLLYCSGGNDEGIASIPASVTAIADKAFMGNTNLVNVTIPETIKNIGTSAFENCVNLQRVTLPTALETLGERALTGCTSLSSISIPELITDIPAYAFSGCTSLSEIGFHDGVKSILNNAFENCTSLKEITFPAEIDRLGLYAFSGCTGFTSMTVPETVTFIGGFAFAGCSNLESITLPFTGSSLYGTYGFAHIFGGDAANVPASLKSVTITGVCQIARNAFQNCSGITNIYLSEKTMEIGSGAFSGCSSLETLTLPFVGTGNTLLAGMESGLFGCVFGKASYTGSTKITQQYGETALYTASYYIPNSLKTVNILGGELTYGAFSGCTTVEKINLGNITAVSGDMVFDGCTGVNMEIPEGESGYYVGTETNKYFIFVRPESTDITSIKINENTKFICGSAFKNCTSLVSVDLPAGLISIGDSAFSGCTALKNITLPSGLSNIGDRAFFECDSLESVTIPEKVSTIAPYLFCQCDKLTSVKFNGAISAIGSFAFSNCVKLNGIDIPEGCTDIGERAFQGCTSLVSVKIPATLQTIGDSAFAGARISDAVYITSLEAWLAIDMRSNPVSYAVNALKLNGEAITELVIPEGITEIGDYAFQNCSFVKSVVIPSTVRRIGNYAFSGCKSLESVTIPSNVTYIGECAFSGCESLESIVVPEAVTQLGKGAFSGCTELRSATLPSGITVIKEALFKDCEKLQSVNIPSRVTTIEAEAFRNCASLMSITLPASLRQTNYSNAIGTNAFAGCYRLVEIYNLSSINIARDDNHPEFWGGVAAHSYVIHTSATTPTRIRVDGDWIYFTMSNTIHSTIGYTDQLLISYIGSDTDVTLPSGRTYYVNGYAFYGTDVEKITFSSHVIGMFDHAFAYAKKLVSVDTGNSSSYIGNYAFYQCSALEEVTIGSNITTIGNYAFDGCSKLTKAYFAVTDGWEYRKPLFENIAITGLSNYYTAAEKLKGISDRSMARS